jgi:hypothetical protein
MKLPGPQHLGLVYVVSEALLTMTRRSRGTGERQDRSTLRLLWIIISLSVFAGIYIAQIGAARNGVAFGALGNLARMAAWTDRDLCRRLLACDHHGRRAGGRKARGGGLAD